MASVYAEPRARNKRHYIAASSFNTVFYGYSTTLNPTTYNTTGALTAISGTNTSNCAQGHILREVGKRLYPDAHPGISTMMVEVYDANSGIRGYIDPNAPQFAVFNSDKPVEIVDGGDNNTTTTHKGQPVFTTGDVIAGGNAIISGLVSGSAASGITAAGSNRATATQLTAQLNNVTTAAASTGVVLPASNIGTVIYVVNNGANAIKVYAANSATIDGTAGSTGVTLTNSRRAIFLYVATDVWLSLGVTAGST